MLATSFVLLLAFFCQSATTQGIEAFRQGRYPDALVDLQKAVAADPNDSTVQAFLGMTRAAMRSCADAATQFNSDPDASLARLSGIAAIECHLATDHSSEALALVARLQVRFPTDADVLYESAKVYRKAWDRAVREMYEKTPASYHVNQLSAEVFEAQGKYNEAVAQYQKAIDKAPDALNLHFRLGRCLLLDQPTPENLQKAHLAFDAELKLNPSDAVAEYQVGQILAAERKPDEALAHAEHALQIHPDFAEALIAVGKGRVQARRYDDAAKLFEKAAALQPDNEAAHYNLMLAYRNLGRTSDALAQKKELDRLQKPPEGEFSDFLKKLGEKPPAP